MNTILIHLSHPQSQHHANEKILEFIKSETYNCHIGQPLYFLYSPKRNESKWPKHGTHCPPGNVEGPSQIHTLYQG